MKLQVAIDLLDRESALRLAGEVRQYADIIEIGTPLIKSEGLDVVRAVKSAFPEIPVLADMKTADTGELEARLALDAGADLIGVLGTAGNATIRGAIKAARERNKAVVVDLISVPDKISRAREVIGFGADLVEFHSSADERDSPEFDFAGLLDEAVRSGVRFSFASGVDRSTVAAVQAAGAEIAVIGGAIYQSTDPAATIRELRSLAGLSEYRTA
ncbi:MAG: 3-hexulose-6-phosphate synthase [Propionicimonas sp.]|nr:3-hexulose-6-phosphate synthase [Propionicimonas sp.]